MKEFIDKLIERLEEIEKPLDKEITRAFYEDKDTDNPRYIFAVGESHMIREAIKIAKQLAEEYKVSEMPTGWIPVSERLPSESGKYLVTAKNITGWWILENNVFVCDYAYDTFIFQGWEDNEVIAWRELPTPYTEGE